MNVLDKFRYCPICGSQQFKVNSSKSKTSLKQSQKAGNGSVQTQIGGINNDRR